MAHIPTGPKPEHRVRERVSLVPCGLNGCAILTAYGLCAKHQRPAELRGIRDRRWGAVSEAAA